MAEQVDVKIVTVGAVQNLTDLKNVISDAKKALAGMELGSKEYQEQLAELIKAQNLMRGAMNGTTASMEDLTSAVDGTAHSYNSLVNQMADYKRELRNIDTSTKEGQKSFDDLAKKINAINDELKEMDAKQGSFVRNVGNYTSGLKNLGEILKNNIPALSGVAKGVGDVDKAMGVMSKQPLLGIIGLLAPLIGKIVEGLKENETALAGVKKMMDAAKPVTDFLANLLDDVVEILGDLIVRVSEFFSGSNIFNKIIQGVVGVGNAILKFVVSPFKGIIAAIKVFQDEGVKGLRNAGKAFLSEMGSGFAFQANYEAGAKMADTMMAGARSRKKQQRETGKAIVQEVAKGAEESIDEMIAKAFERAEKAAAERLRNRQEKDNLINETTQLIEDQMTAEIDAYLEGERVMYETSVQMAKDAAKQKLDALNGYASGMSSILSSTADLMEEEGKSAKNLRIAAATIDMIQGAVTAYSTAQSLGPIAGPIVGALNAAAVVASGMANIAKIRSTQVSKDSAPSTTAAPVSVSAPATATVTPTTVTTGARTESYLNNAAQPQRVYILQSDIEAAGNASRTQVAESSF